MCFVCKQSLYLFDPTRRHRCDVLISPPVWVAKQLTALEAEVAKKSEDEHRRLTDRWGLIMYIGAVWMSRELRASRVEVLVKNDIIELFHEK